MKLLVSCFRQTLTLALMLVVSVCFLFFIHFCHSATLSLATQPLTRDAYDKDTVADNSWDKLPYDNTSGLLWFVHITDLHISKFWSPDRVQDLEYFCRFMKRSIKPPVAVITGDLTDAKTSNKVGSTQYEEEWTTYKSLWRDYCQINGSSDTLWLDIRGNHDTFNVKSDEADNNFFLKYGVQGRTEKRSYLKTLQHNGRKFAFVGIDSTLSPGPKRPFNFFGSLTPSQMDHVDSLLKQGQAYNDAGLVVFGHYPLSTVISPHPGVKTLVGRAQANAYLSGHLHNLLELAPKMYTKQPEGFLDLELADWKDHRAYRLAALDRGHFSFTDQVFKGQKAGAVILITNPLDARFVYGPKIKHGFNSMLNSTHIRTLVFADDDVIEKVVAEVDQGRETLEMTHVQGPLYIARWFPRIYNDGKLHNISVTVTLQNRKEVVSSDRQFALSIEGLDAVEDFGVLQRFVLMSNLSMILQAGFGVSIMIILVPMCSFRLFHKLALEDRFRRPRRPKSVLKRMAFNLIKAFWIVSNVDQIFYPVVGYLALVAFGPWGIGYFLENDIGIVFSWGIFVAGTWLPTYTTFIYSYWFMVPYWYIMLAGITWIVSAKYDDVTRIFNATYDDVTDTSSFPDSFAAYFCRHLWFFLVMLLQGLHCIEFYFAYGLLALFSVCGLFRLVAFYYLWSRAVTLQHNDFVQNGLTSIWSPTDQVKKS